MRYERLGVSTILVVGGSGEYLTPAERVYRMEDYRISDAPANMFTGANAFNIFFFRQFFLSIPKDLENAAIIDGCTRLGVFFRIVLPNAKPAIATTAILSFRSVWNAFLWPMLVINDYDKLTLTVGLKYLKEWEPNWAVLLAGASLSIVPIVIVFLIFQKQFMASTMNSGFGGK